MEKIIIIGAGLCGTLLAIRMAQRGYEVKLYERRGDMRLAHVDAGRSINLALSARGLWALDRVGMKEQILKECIPMKARGIHTIDGQEFFSPYSGRSEDYINSVSRGGLNIALMNKADELDNIELIFNVKCQHIDIENAVAHLVAEDGTAFTDEGDIVIGTDGAGSAVRRSLMSQTTKLLFNYSQDFLRHGYKELSILPTDTNGWAIEKNALHIWPNGEFMIIALPNLDGSFTVTMFHPYEGEVGFNTLDTWPKVKAMFEKYYPSLIPLIPHLEEEYFENPVGTLGTIKCFPWQAYGKTLVMGDASHAIVPFYGQGMNASFEDVRVFDDVMEEHTGDWDATFKRFEDLRVENATAIADLAIDNFYEMRDHVDDVNFMKKRKIETAMEQQFPDYYSKYSLVTFKPNMPYADAKRMGRAQDELLLKMVAGKEVNDIDLNEVKHAIEELWAQS